MARAVPLAWATRLPRSTPVSIAEALRTELHAATRVRRRPPVSVSPVGRDRPGEVVAGFLAAFALTASAIAWAYKPLLLAPFGLLVAFVAAGLGGGRHDGLIRFAVWFGALSWVAGMTVAVVTDNPLY